MDAIGSSCLLCRLGWRPRRGRKGPLINAIEGRDGPVMLCPYHERLYYGTEKDHNEAFALIAPYLLEGLRTNEVYIEEWHAEGKE